MKKIRYFKLKNDADFVVHIEIEWTHFDGDGNESHGTFREKGYHDICKHAERTIDMKETIIPNGATVNIKAEVVAGNDKTGEEKFIFKKDASATAVYCVTGTTLFNKLEMASCD